MKKGWMRYSIFFHWKLWSSIPYNTSARHKQHERNTRNTSVTRLWHKWDSYNRNVAWVLHERRECDTSQKSLILVTAWVKTYFYTPILAIWQMKYCKKSNNFLLRTILWKCLVFKMRLKIAPQKLNFVMGKATSKCYTLDYSCKGSCTFPQSYA